MISWRKDTYRLTFFWHVVFQFPLIPTQENLPKSNVRLCDSVILWVVCLQNLLWRRIPTQKILPESYYGRWLNEYLTFASQLYYIIHIYQWLSYLSIFTRVTYLPVHSAIASSWFGLISLSSWLGGMLSISYYRVINGMLCLGFPCCFRCTIYIAQLTTE